MLFMQLHDRMLLFHIYQCELVVSIVALKHNDRPTEAYCSLMVIKCKRQDLTCLRDLESVPTCSHQSVLPVYSSIRYRNRKIRSIKSSLFRLYRLVKTQARL